MWGVVKVRGNRLMQSICCMYKLRFCVIHDLGRREGVLEMAAPFSLIREGFVKEQWLQEIFEVIPTRS